MTLYVRSYSYSDPDFSDTPVVENDEGSRTYMHQVRSAGQQYIAVIMRETTDTENTVVKVIKKDATELYEVVINKPAKQWDVNDNGEVLLYTETASNGSVVRELICIDNTGSIKWTVDLGDTEVDAVELGTSYAGIVYGNHARFYSASDGSEVVDVNTGVEFRSNWEGGKYQECYGSNDGFTLVYQGAGYKVVFVNADGDYWVYDVRFRGNYCRNMWITGRDTSCGKVSVVTQSYLGSSCYPADYRGVLMVIFRTGESPYIDCPSGERVGECIISPCGEWVIRAYNGKIYLYYVTATELKLISETEYHPDRSGEKSADLSFYGKFALILHGDNVLQAYNLKEQAYRDSLDNPLGTRAVMLCSD